jgi:hypothetical protein
MLPTEDGGHLVIKHLDSEEVTSSRSVGRSVRRYGWGMSLNESQPI